MPFTIKPFLPCYDRPLFSDNAVMSAPTCGTCQSVSSLFRSVTSSPVPAMLGKFSNSKLSSPVTGPYRGGSLMAQLKCAARQSPGVV
ncbi:hypothetical protein ACOMHN_058180 [Nucella lapillus]